MKDVIILGGGASALMCACMLKEKDVTIIEKNSTLGKKILATGNGRCNLSNLDKDFLKNLEKYYGTNIVKEYFEKFGVSDTLNFFDSLGLECYADEEGRVYPRSDSAQSVVDVLNNFLQYNKNVTHLCGELRKIEKCENGYKVTFDNQQILTKRVVVATGNLTDLKIYENLGIKCKKFTKSLCAIKTQKLKEISGLRCDNVKVSCKKFDFKEVGEILFKDEGISGIVIFNLSAYMSRANDFSGEISLDFMPNVSAGNLFKNLKNRKEKLENYKVRDFLVGFLHKKLMFFFLNHLKINEQKLAQELTDKELSQIVNLIKDFKLFATGNYDNNQVCSGGIKLDQLDQNLMSKNCPGLYFIGEAVDVDGACGGFNLQWAWTSGAIVGKNL